MDNLIPMNNIDTEIKAYTFRRLNSSDLFLTIKLIGKIGPDELVAALDKDSLKKLISRTRNENKDENKDEDVQAERSVAGVEVLAKLAGKT